jgi:hypothetical protein
MGLKFRVLGLFCMLGSLPHFYGGDGDRALQLMGAGLLLTWAGENVTKESLRNLWHNIRRIMIV